MNDVPKPPAGLQGPMKAMSPGVVDFLFRQLVSGEPPEDTQWRKEGTALGEQVPGPELARRLSETDVSSLTPLELFEYVRASQHLVTWAEQLKERAVAQYCADEPARAPKPA
ncbi:hypothetical protein [Paenarthrobacter aurescens]|uniref:Uncharacterized protein n=1 Tax=Paenarthrobacter aurescens TaxID=43663 RepID=A0A4Y3ND41_PAEAU|nr:hypothetical protein [Paenarthrobacter aurescens]UKA51345.1 hypothetical protein LFT48_07450 [Arthrobacter sp. FW305-123]MDO6143100.1 hypothetical protein [Paenarthrobacter aurescens]MDO6146945.1 hypothetical protein [Paenarthrobacter aurescens]MDO6158191.1 hypothetical protein [Paenarthrobacter aurescens]MDO6162176.1 hypothetical protein [Paenarthrobacter aurescens]